jgi:uncharacterized protein (DUF2141 family)
MMAKLILMLSTIWTLGTVGVDVPTGDLIIVVRELKSTEGQVGILVFNKKDGFPADREMAVRDVLLPIKNGVIQYTFSGLPFGEYAVAVMHDENKNNELDTNFFGVPKEGNGVSNNVVNPLGAPKFQKAVFSLNQKSHAIEINMRY